MKIEIKGREYALEMRNEIGPNYRYEAIWGESYFDAMARAHKEAEKKANLGGLTKLSIVVMKMVWAILVNDNEVVECSFDDMMRELSESQIVECMNFYNERFAFFHGGQKEAPSNSPREGENLDLAERGENEPSAVLGEATSLRPLNEGGVKKK